MLFNKKSANKLAISLLAVNLAACGSLLTGHRQGDRSGDKDEASALVLDCGESSHDNTGSSVRLKGAALLAKTFQATLGDGITIDAVSNEDLFNNETTAQNFGKTTEGLYADVKSENQAMTSYLMSLSYAGRTAAVNCGVRGFEGLCKCDSEESAAAMLQRAISFRRFCAGTNDEYVTNLAALCAKNHTDGITAVMTSIAIALLQ